MEKPLKTVWVAPEVEWGRAAGNYQGGANSVSQVDGVSEMAPACWPCGSLGRAPKGIAASVITSVWGKAAPTPAFAPMPGNSVPSHMSLVPFSLLPPALELREGESQHVSEWALYRELPGTLEFSPTASIPAEFCSQKL